MICDGDIEDEGGNKSEGMVDQVQLCFKVTMRQRNNNE